MVTRKGAGRVTGVADDGGNAVASGRADALGNDNALGSERLRAAPVFALAHALDGKPYVVQEADPFTQYWLSDRELAVLGAFSGRRGATLTDALDAVQRQMQTGGDAAERRRLLRTVAQMREAQVLVAAQADTSRYDKRIVDAYVKHRPFPQAVADALVADGGIGRASRVLDIAGGPGSLALALARASDHVSLMDLSRGFVQAAAARAKAAGLKLTALHESANRLLLRDDEYDVITVSQALHWLDDVQVCRGVCRLLAPGGSFFVVHAAIELPDAHPLAHVFGWDSVLGRKPRRRFADELAPLRQRLALLFEALELPGVDRHGLAPRADAQPLQHTATTLFSQARPIDEAYARAFLTDQHILAAGLDPAEFWPDLVGRCQRAGPEALQGRMHWGLLQFRRGGPRAKGKPAPARAI